MDGRRTDMVRQAGRVQCACAGLGGPRPMCHLVPPIPKAPTPTRVSQSIMLPQPPAFLSRHLSSLFVVPRHDLLTYMCGVRIPFRERVGVQLFDLIQQWRDTVAVHKVRVAQHVTHLAQKEGVGAGAWHKINGGWAPCAISAEDALGKGRVAVRDITPPPPQSTALLQIGLNTNPVVTRTSIATHT
jgi:hypothetical protein